MRELTEPERRALTRALRRPVGRYGFERASQLSGVPERTLHHWAKNGVFVPDFDDEHPKQWSYRDLVLVRVFVWLRSKNFTPSEARDRVESIREHLATRQLDPRMLLRSTRRSLLLADEDVDRLTGEGPIPGLVTFIDDFDLLDPLHEKLHVAGPDLLYPSTLTYISPWVHGGEPCVRTTRIPTASLWALHEQQGLDVAEIARLYPDVGSDEVTDALKLERQVRHLQAAA